MRLLFALPLLVAALFFTGSATADAETDCAGPDGALGVLRADAGLDSPVQNYAN
jgi:hypothetical protein